jgi:hypothetical protein
MDKPFATTTFAAAPAAGKRKCTPPSLPDGNPNTVDCAQGDGTAKARSQRQRVAPADEAVDAARCGNVNLLHSLYSRRHVMDWRVAESGAAAGHIAVLDWAWDHRIELNKRLCEAGARAGHQHVLEWAVAHHIPWDERTCFEAACAGHLELLGWLRAHNCPWNWWCVEAALARNDTAMVNWMLAQADPPRELPSSAALRQPPAAPLRSSRARRHAHPAGRAPRPAARRLVFALASRCGLVAPALSGRALALQSQQNKIYNQDL